MRKIIMFILAAIISSFLVVMLKHIYISVHPSDTKTVEILSFITHLASGALIGMMIWKPKEE